jgi:hypothetical protein
MKQAPCPQEANILQAIRTGNWQESLVAHQLSCAACGELARAARWMQSLAQNSASVTSLPDPTRIWWRAQISRNQARAEKTQEYFDWMEIISASVLCAAFAGWILLHWSGVQVFLAATLATALPHSWVAATPLSAMAAIVVPLAVGFVSLGAAVLAYPILARD